MLKRVLFVAMINVLGLFCIGCGDKVSLRDAVLDLQDAGIASISNSDMSIELVDKDTNSAFANKGSVLYDIDGDLVGDAYIGISNTDIFKKIKEDRYLVSNADGDIICITLVDNGKEPNCPNDMTACKINQGV